MGGGGMNELHLQLMSLVLVSKLLHERGTDVRNLEQEADRLYGLKRRLKRQANLAAAA
jgi:hypothetical protein